MATPMATWASIVPRPFVVRDRVVETGDTVTLDLVPVGGGPVPEFAPGQFNMLSPFGSGEVAISISGSDEARGSWTHTVRSAGKVTDLLTRLAPGATLGLRGPYGVGWPLASARDHDLLIVAGGLGLPPLRPAIRRILANRGAYGRVEIIYGARTPPDLVFAPEIQRWRLRDDLRFQTTVDAAGRDWYGDVGLVTARIPDARFDPARTLVWACGPEIMMRAVAQAAIARGVPPEAIFLSMERNMKCAVGWCGHCQFGPSFVCRDGPVLPFPVLAPWLAVREV